MAREELRLQTQGIGKGDRGKKGKGMNQLLHLAFPNRTMEGIKRERQGRRYKEVLKLALNDSGPDVNDIPTPTGSYQEEDSDNGETDPIGTCTGPRTCLDSVARGNLGTGGRYKAGGPVVPQEQGSPTAQSPTGYGVGPDEASCIAALLVSCEANREAFCLDKSLLTQLFSLLQDPVGDQDVIQSLIDLEYGTWIARLKENSPTVVKPTRHRKPGVQSKRKCTGRKAKRRNQYRTVQTLYRRNRSRCAELVLSGDWNKVVHSLPLSSQDQFWRGMFEAPSKVDQRSPKARCCPLMELLEPVLPAEYAAMLKTTKNGSPGIDGFDRAFVRSIEIDDGRSHFNLWLAAGRPPSPFKEGITLPIPKTADASKPSDFRPLTMGSMVVRFFHRIIAKRLERAVPLSPRQKAFREGDGLADNTWLLRSIIKDSQVAHKPLIATFIDVSKAFDTVSHQSLLRASARLGVPPLLVRYIKNLYTGSTTRLKVEGQLGSDMSVNRGVRQGDPLSPMLFNMIMDWVLGEIDPLLGITLQGRAHLNHLAFADDVTLLSRNPKAMLAMSAQFESALADVGLKPNANKSATLRIATSGKQKRWVCDPTPLLTLDGCDVPSIDICGAYKYLGVQIGARKSVSRAVGRLEEHLLQLRKAPLKPQQRLFFLRVHVIPGLYHLLVLDECHRGVLRKLDILVRRSVRNWLRLPHDTPNSFIHAGSNDGGLGVPELMAIIPLFRRDRINRLVGRANSGSDPVMSELVASSPTLKKEIVKCGMAHTLRGVLMTSKATAVGAAAAALHNSVDGRGLRDHSLVPAVNRWVSDGSSLLTGRNFVGAISIRAASLYSALRASRGRSNPDTRCDCCGRVESLGHILQVCPRTFVGRDERHNRVAGAVIKLLSKKDFLILEEPAIPTVEGTRRPDIIAYKPGQSAHVIDVTVVADNADLDTEHCKKMDYYDRPDIRTWVGNAAQCSGADVVFSAVAFNWRGALSVLSAVALRNLGATDHDITLLAVVAVEKGYYIWRQFKNDTWRPTLPRQGAATVHQTRVAVAVRKHPP
jgi:hypothetical protein